MLRILTIGLLLISPSLLHAQIITWNNATEGTFDFGGMATVSGPAVAVGDTATLDLSGTDYSASPGSASELVPVVEIDTYTIDFSPAVSSLDFYGVFLRGFGNGEPDRTIAFDTGGGPTPVIASGFGAATVSGNTLTLPGGTSFYDGILRFNGTVSSLTITTNKLNDSQEAFSLGAPSAAAAIPEPSSFLALGIIGLVATARRRASWIGKVLS